MNMRRDSLRWRWVWVGAVLGLVACGGSGSATQTPQLSSPAGTSSSTVQMSPQPLFSDPVGVAFDPSRNAWVADYRQSTLQRFDATNLMGAGAEHVEPSVVISDAGGPNQLRFGPDGRLWVVAYDQSEVRAYDPSQLTSSGARHASIVIRGSHIGSPTDLAFDATGRLWVANQDSGEVIAFARRALRTSSSRRPEVILRIPGFGRGTAEAIAFDRDGRLWVSSYEGDVVVALLPKDLHTGSPSPGVRLRLPTLSGPIGLTVRRDRLWIAEASANAVVAYGLSREGPSRGPVATIRDPSQTMPHSITFDDRGDAWVPYSNGIVGRFRSDRLGARHVTGGDLVLR